LETCFKIVLADWSELHESENDVSLEGPATHLCLVYIACRSYEKKRHFTGPPWHLMTWPNLTPTCECSYDISGTTLLRIYESHRKNECGYDGNSASDRARMFRCCTYFSILYPTTLILDTSDSIVETSWCFALSSYCSSGNVRLPATGQKPTRTLHMFYSLVQDICMHIWRGAPKVTPSMITANGKYCNMYNMVGCNKKVIVVATVAPV
jgi:hypothetical protein